MRESYLETVTSNPVSGRSPRKTVLIVDDSRAIRGWLRSVLASDPRLEIIGEACNAVEARDFLRAQPVDVLTLDIEMPGMSGLEFLARLMRARPMPVVMLSSLTSAGSDAAVQALSQGAIDCILKPTNGFDQNLSRDICDRVYEAACTKPVHMLKAPSTIASPAQRSAQHSPGYGQPCRRGSLILIGASTGGVSALETVLHGLDPVGPPVVIVQHMPDNFLESFANRLQRYLPQNVRLAEQGRPLCRGDVVLAPARGKHTRVNRKARGWFCEFSDVDTEALHCPSIDELFLSAVSEAQHITAAILTGLGKDGAQGLLALAKNGARTIGQDEETCVVYGMPRAAYKIGAVQQQLAIGKIGPSIRETTMRKRTNDRSKKLCT